MTMLYVNSCCCTCLSTENLLSLQSRDSENVKLLDKLLFCMTEKDSIFECAPLLICDKCGRNLQELYKFKKFGTKNLELFRNCLKQLIRNPFASLAIKENGPMQHESQLHETQNTNTSSNAEIQMQSEQQPIVAANIKMEVTDEEQQTSQENQHKQGTSKANASTSESANPENMPLLINNIESLNKSYRNPMATKRFRTTVCQPCDKSFIRHDFYIKHILMCPKTDLKTKNQVLNWAEKNKKIVIKEQDGSSSVQISESSFSCNRNKQLVLGNQSDEKSKVYNRRGPKRGPMERSFCPKCKKKIATPFLKRHYRCCKILNSQKKNKTHDDTEESDTTTEEDNSENDPMKNTTV